MVSRSALCKYIIFSFVVALQAGEDDEYKRKKFALLCADFPSVAYHQLYDIRFKKFDYSTWLLIQRISNPIGIIPSNKKLIDVSLINKCLETRGD